MEQFSQFFNLLLRQLQWISWKFLLGLIAVCFIISSILSTICAAWLMPELNNSLFTKVQEQVSLRKDKASLDGQDLTDILARNIFNADGALADEDTNNNKEVDEADRDNIVATKLPLKLIGTIYSGDPSSGLAVIEDNATKNQNSFMVGDVVLKGAKLFAVHKQRVIFDLGDHKEFLAIESRLAFKNRNQLKQNVRKKSEDTPASADSYKEDGFERQGSKISMSQDYRSKMLGGDFAKVLQDAKAEPFFEGGELSGFKLVKIRKDSIYEKAGLMNEDVVKEINGVSLKDVGQSIKLLNSIKGETEIEIKLMRNNGPVTINMQVRG